jgi:hypothetical protein
MTDSAIYEIMYPYCRGELLAFVTKALTVLRSFETFHALLLGQFIPSRQLSQLRVDRYVRVQGEGEPLATYVQSIRDAGLMLRIRETEAQVVERIVEGLTPAHRARYDFQAPPFSFRQLEQLAVVDRNIAYTDQTRAVQSTAVTVGVVESHPKHPDPRSAGPQLSQVSRPGKSLVCFYCRKPGHIQRRCFLRLTQLRKSDRPAATGQPWLGRPARRIVRIATKLPPQIMAQV